jgi:hypothetical protein
MRFFIDIVLPGYKLPEADLKYGPAIVPLNKGNADEEIKRHIKLQIIAVSFSYDYNDHDGHSRRNR